MTPSQRIVRRSKMPFISSSAKAYKVRVSPPTRLPLSAPTIEEITVFIRCRWIGSSGPGNESGSVGRIPGVSETNPIASTICVRIGLEPLRTMMMMILESGLISSVLRPMAD